MTKLAQQYFANIFVSVVMNADKWLVYSKVVKNKKITSKFSKTFEVTEDGQISDSMNKYLDRLQDDYNFAYIAFFLDSMGQGAIKGTTALEFEKNSVDMKNVTHFTVNDSWSVYASFIDINWTKKLFSQSGIDFIYSPFMVLYRLISSQQLRSEPMMYLLNHEDSLTISVFSNGNLLFGAFFRTNTNEQLSEADSDDEDWDSADEAEDVENLIELDSIGEDDMGDGFQQLDDLDSFDNLEEEKMPDSFSGYDDEEKSLGRFESDSTTGEDLELFGRDILLRKYLKTALDEYYKNPLYESYFIERVVIYDGYEISSDMIEIIENDLLMDIEMHKIDIPEIICDMAIKEGLQ